jgi:hypothetical protein
LTAWLDTPDSPDVPADPRCYYDDGWWCPCSRREEAGALAVLGVCLAPWAWLVVWLLGRGR